MYGSEEPPNKGSDYMYADIAQIALCYASVSVGNYPTFGLK